jgi:hypothetical protein
LTRETPEQRQEVIAKAVEAAAQRKQRQAAATAQRLRAERDAARAFGVEGVDSGS